MIDSEFLLSTILSYIHMGQCNEKVPNTLEPETLCLDEEI